jgi:hypothetical protein
MPDTAEYHRSFVLYTAPRGEFGMFPVKGYISYVPQKYYEDADRRNNGIPAFRLRGDGTVQQVLLAKKPDQNFSRYATPWESIYSPLCGGQGTDPVVNDDLEVIGHVGWFSPSFIFVQRGIGAIDRDGDGRVDELLTINETIERHGTVRVAMTRVTGHNSIAIVNPDPDTEVSYNNGLAGGDANSFRLLTDKHGVVKLQVGYRVNDGLAPPAIDPFLLLGIGRLVFSLGKGLASMLVRRTGAKVLAEGGEDLAGATMRGMGAMGPKGEVRIATGRATSRGMGAAGPGRPAIPMPRVGPGGRLELTVDEMGNRLAPLFKANPEFARLMQARALRGDALKREIEAILKSWEKRTGKQLEIVEDGVVQRMTGTPRNFASMQGNKLLIEQSAFEAPDKLYEEAVHELASSALGGRGAPHIWITGNSLWNAQKILEAWISKTGSFDWFRQLLDVPDP